MRKLMLSALALMGLGGMWSEAVAQFSVYKDGKVLFSMEETPEYVDFTYHKPLKGSTNGYEWVDMGLSVKWATVNVGASKSEDFGGYYAWGETATKDDYSWGTYAHMKSGQNTWYNVNKYQVNDYQYEGVWYKDAKYYNNGGKTVLDAADDAAAANWQGGWVMPTIEDWQELYDNCDSEWTGDYKGDGSNKAGYIFKSKKSGNSNSIFLPAAGFYDGSDFGYEGSYGYYWSSSLDEKDSNIGSSVYFLSGCFYPYYSLSRYYGQSVRPVCPASGVTYAHDAVDLGLPSGKLWATCNVGASAPEDCGSYFAWGETTTKSDYSWETYTGEPAKFIGDNKTALEAADDVATQSWGEEWRMPTIAEWEELYSNTTRVWTNDYNGTGVKGYILTSKVEGHTDVSIFLPAAGCREGSGLDKEGLHGNYWSSSLRESHSNYGRYVYFNSGSFSMNSYGNRCRGRSVRPVCTK